jgi:hypothetical protein
VCLVLQEATHDSLSGGLPPPVTSRGCCRAYICFVLYRALLYVQLLRRHDYAVFFPFPVHFIEQWLLLAQFDCANNVRYQELLGGTLLQANDPSTFWTIPQQFFTWYVPSRAASHLACMMLRQRNAVFTAVLTILLSCMDMVS